MKLKHLTIALVLTGFCATSVMANSLNNRVDSLQLAVNKLQAQHHAKANFHNFVHTNAKLSWNMLNIGSGVGKELFILKAKKNAELLNRSLYLGGFLWGSARYSNMHVDPGFAKWFTGGNQTKLAINNVALEAIGTVTPWASTYLELNSYEPMTQDVDFHLAKAYLLLGDLKKLPVYGFVGKKDVNFGSFDSVNLYTRTLVSNWFQAEGNLAGVGLLYHGFNAVFDLIPGGSQINMNTKSFHHLNNFAINLKYSAKTGIANWTLGAGYLNASAFGAARSLSGYPYFELLNSSAAWDLNGKLNIGAAEFLFEYARTANDVNYYRSVSNFFGVYAQPGDAYAWDVGAAYHFHLLGKLTTASFDYGNWAFLSPPVEKQVVLGLSQEVLSNVTVGLEYTFDNNVRFGSYFTPRYSEFRKLNQVVFVVKAAF